MTEIKEPNLMGLRQEIKEVIVVEGRDDTRAIKESVRAETIETHGFGIRKETWELLELAYKKSGLIIFTDPDYSGEQIRKRLTEKFPEAKQAFLDRDSATAGLDVGIENANGQAICKALEKARPCKIAPCHTFVMEDLQGAMLWGGQGSAERRKNIGKKLGIGYGNSKVFLSKLNKYGITKEEFYEAIYSQDHKNDKG